MALVDHLLKTLKNLFTPSVPQKRRKCVVLKRKIPLKRSGGLSKRKLSSVGGKRKSPVAKSRVKVKPRSSGAAVKKGPLQKKTVKKVSQRKVPVPSRVSGVKKKLPAKRVIKTLKSGQKAPRAAKSETAGVLVGEVTHYFSKIQVCVLKITGKGLVIYDKIHFQGTSTDFKQTVRSLQVESLDVKVAKNGQLVGLKVDKLVKIGDKVYKD